MTPEHNAESDVTLRPPDAFIVIDAETGKELGYWNVVRIDAKDGWVPRIFVQDGIALGTPGDRLRRVTDEQH